MSRYACHDQPDAMLFETEIIGAQPGAVLLRRSLFYPGGGGQLPDRGRLIAAQGEFAVTGIEMRGDNAWHTLDRPVELHGAVRGEVGLRRASGPDRRSATFCL